MTLHFSHIGFTEARTFIAPVSSRIQDSRQPQESGKRTPPAQLGRTRKIAGDVTGGDQPQREPVVALYADGLDRRRAHPGVASELLVQAALGDGGGIVAARLGQRPIADDIVGDDQGAGPGVIQGPGEVLGGIHLVGVDEDEVEGPRPLRLEIRQGLERRSDAELDEVGEPGLGDVLAGDLGVGGVCLEGRSGGRRRAGHDRSRSSCNRRGCRTRARPVPRSSVPEGGAACPVAARPGSPAGLPPDSARPCGEAPRRRGRSSRRRTRPPRPSGHPPPALLVLVPGGEDSRPIGGDRDRELEVGGERPVL